MRLSPSTWVQHYQETRKGKGVRPYLVRPPKIYRWLYPEATFRLPENEKIVYLTFDDGPHPEATPFVLEVLQQNEIKATFFLLGRNAERYPNLVERLRAEGHCIGNHGMNHLNGWSSGLEEYITDVEEGRNAVGSSLFRPPFGRLSLRQYNELKRTDRIIFWDVISGDFDSEIDGKRVVTNVIKHAREGSIIVMHDSLTALNNLKTSLSEIIYQLSKKGYRFNTIQDR